jgi:hypothetical protein
MIDVYHGQIWHVPFHEIILCSAVVIYVHHGRQASKYETETKEQIGWLSFPVQFWVNELHPSPSCEGVAS